MHFSLNIYFRLLKKKKTLLPVVLYSTNCSELDNNCSWAIVNTYTVPCFPSSALWYLQLYFPIVHYHSLYLWSVFSRGACGLTVPRVECVCLGPLLCSDTEMQMVQGAGPGVPLDTLWQSAGSCSLADYKTGNPFNYLWSRRRGGVGGWQRRTVFPEHSARERVGRRRRVGNNGSGERKKGTRENRYCKES